MKKSVYLLLPFFLAGFMLPDDNCGNNPPSGNLYDGPYVMYKGQWVHVKSVYDDGGNKTVMHDSLSLSRRDSLTFQVATDEAGKTFSVRLKKDLQNEKTEYPDVKKLFIVSDIEGNFRALRKLLQTNGVMDEQFNWTFGNGHLVLTGDFFDRGSQVTEVLWLIYSLETKAQAAGGYVHFVLGNHEIMNLSGDVRYVHPKYMENAVLMDEDYMGLFSEHTELGRWLRTKNVVERVGDILFVHGGISAQLNSIDLAASKINKLSRPFYPDSSYKYNDPKVALLFSDDGPFWYRGYYTGKTLATQAQVDSTLDIYKVKFIATGHTLVADTVSVLFNKKVYNTDVHHARGHSEALLFENGNFYRVNAFGEKFQIGD